jgi:putative flippase GtrA
MFPDFATILSMRSIRFLATGVITTFVQFLVLIISAQLTPPVTAAIIAYAVAIPVNYLLSYYFTFEAQGSHGRRAIKFLTICFLGLGLNTLVFSAILTLGIHYVAAQVVATAVVFAWNFYGLQRWAFRPAHVDNSAISSPVAVSRSRTRTFR